MISKNKAILSAALIISWHIKPHHPLSGKAQRGKPQELNCGFFILQEPTYEIEVSEEHNSQK
ncbi:hypothetical protein GCM10007096_37960 [Pullulanibacillus pueri]|uniref:Uncharacterized protein n=1 Tax=Pullulanibacillus pueri TaxID=1437324 RepID=A0A8J3A046_9BACL|nr:hypothetical protein GCM10007096_37960 [Pullulanibacillus pueri]